MRNQKVAGLQSIANSLVQIV